ncbi:MAG TPA: NAD(P)-binding domain-containing protein [Rhizomicrobium sp.]|nr:NAD(P)-binding domain-containing protein [Rhizomicrobium sp.]
MVGHLYAIARRALLLAVVATLATLPVQAQGKMKIGIIGVGRIGSALAKLWAEAGYPVMISARNLDEVKTLAAQIGHGVQAGTPAQAAAFGQVVLISVPFGALPQIGKDYAAELKGKIVLDTCNPYLNRDGEMAREALEKGTGVVDPTYLPGTRLVRAFNQVNSVKLVSEAHRTGEKIGVPLAADDKAALAIARQLVIDAGFDPVVVGGLATAKNFDPGSPAYHTMTARELRQTLGLK